jgi:hypothetical protein
MAAPSAGIASSQALGPAPGTAARAQLLPLVLPPVLDPPAPAELL